MHLAGLSITTEPGITILLVLVFCAIAAFSPKSERIFRRIEGSVCGLASRKGVAVSIIFVLVIAVRLALLPPLPMPNPGIHDEFSYLLMADTFTHGRLANPPHPMWMSFETFHVLWFPTYASKYPPAQGVVLALGQILGHPWIGVLLSAAAMTAAIVWALQPWMPARWAFLAGLLVAIKLCVATYWMNSYWGGAAAAFGGALAVGALGRLLRKGGVASAILLALGVAILLNSRPYEAVFFCIPLAVVFFRWLLAQRKHVKGSRMNVLVAVGGGLFITVAWMAYYNWRV